MNNVNEHINLNKHQTWKYKHKLNMKSAISWIILTKHAVLRMRERKITLQAISAAASIGKTTASDQEVGVFISSFNGTVIIFKQAEKDTGIIVIITCYPEIP